MLLEKWNHVFKFAPWKERKTLCLDIRLAVYTVSADVVVKNQIDMKLIFRLLRLNIRLDDGENVCLPVEIPPSSGQANGKAESGTSRLNMINSEHSTHAVHYVRTFNCMQQTAIIGALRI